MNIIDMIKSKINVKKVKLLNSSNIQKNNIQDTQEVITINTIQEILKNKEVFKDFLNPNKNAKFFNENIGFKEYSEAIKEYINFFTLNNVVLDKDELKRAKTITGERYKRAKKKNNYKLEEISAQLLYSEDIKTYKTGQRSFNSITDFAEYIQDKESFKSIFANISVCGNNVIYDEILNSLLEVSSKIETQTKILAIDPKVAEEINSLRKPIIKKEMPNQVISVRKKFEPEKYTLNNEFEKMVMSKIPTNIKDKGKLAYEIYKAIFSIVQYDTGYFIKRTDNLSEDFIQKILNKNISEINEKNSRVTCTTGTELYCYFLSKYGIKSAIVESRPAVQDNCKRRCHCYTEIYLDNDIIKADATNGSRDNNGFNMTDMTRIKLGIKPDNFKSIKNIDYSLTKSYRNKKQLDNTINLDINSIKDLLKKKNSHQIIGTKEKVEILKEQLKKIKKSNLGNYATHQYMSTLMSNLFSNEITERDIGLSSSLYTKDATDVYSYFSIMYIKYAEGKYRYYCYDKDEGIKQIKKASILEMLDSQKLFIVQGREGHIPGLDKKDKDELVI